MNELLRKKPEVAGVLLKSGLGCVGCAMTECENIEQGCKAHGMTNKQIDELIEKLNKEGKKK